MIPDEFDPERPRRGRALAALLVAITALGLLGGGVVLPFALTVGHAAEHAADRFLQARCDVPDETPPQRSTMYANDGHTVLARFFTQNRSPVHLSQVPHGLVRALVDTEDRRFYQHHGVDLRGLARAALHDASGGDTQGGSTLTMQYVKQVRYYRASTDAQRQAAVAPTLDRKLQNAKCALAVEKRYTKDQILEKYLNIAFFGENSYGIATAANTYFGVPVSKLTVPQSAMLVGLLQAPSQYDPFQHPDLARQRRNEVLTNLADVGDLDPAQAEQYAQAPLGLAGHKPPPVQEGCTATTVTNAGFFCDYAVAWLTSHGVSSSRLTTSGLHIVSTLDAPLQERGQAGIWRAGLHPTADYVLVMPSIDPRTGAVTSMISSRSYGLTGDRRAHSVDPLFTAAYAGAGSTYKYFTAVTALTAGAPTSLRLSTPGNRYRTRNCASHYTVHNAGNYPDTMPLRDALPQSSNTYFVALEDQFFGCHLGPVVDTAVRLGMHRLEKPRNSTAKASIAKEVVHSEEPTFTLGQEPTSPLELTSAFSAAANDGVLCPPRPVVRVTTASGALVPLRTESCRRVLTPYVARTVVGLMRRDTHSGTAAEYFRQWYAGGGSDVAGKTGTDNDASDTGNSALWFVGSTPHLVAAASLVNPRNPKQTVHGLPGQPAGSVGQDTFGAYASRYWLAAYGRGLRAPWHWPAPLTVPGGRAVPQVIGRRSGAAAAALRAAGFRAQVFPVACASARPAGTVAYQQPPVAVPGSTITICLSSGHPPYVVKPKPKPVPRHAPPRRHRPPPPPPHPGHHRKPRH